MEEEPQPATQPPVDPISRPSSTSTSASAAVTQLPGIAALAASTVAHNAANEASQQSAPAPRPPPPPPSTQQFNGASPAATTGGNGNNLPTCQNCSTSTTPLWRRDEFGAVLCNACGLFLKLHGRSRPISLKTDVIKSRNRVKTMRTDLGPKKKVVAIAQSPQGVRRKSANGNGEAVESPISRTATPSMYSQSLPFSMEDPYQSTGVSGFGAAAEGGGSPMNGDRGLDGPQTNEQLIAQNASLKTRVSELEFINELFRGRLSQLEQLEADTQRRQEEDRTETSQAASSAENEKQLQAQLEDSHRRENSLKRRLDELEIELKAAQDAKAAMENDQDRPHKKAHIEAEETEKSTNEPKEEQEPKGASETEVPQEAPEATTA